MNKIKEAQREAATKVITDALIQTNGRIIDAARICGVSRQSMWKWLQRLDIDPGQWRIQEDGRKKRQELPHYFV